MNENLIAEELNRINLLMGYNLNNTLTENYNNTKKVLIKENRIVGEILKTESKALAQAATKSELKAAAESAFKNMEQSIARGADETKVLRDTQTGRAIKNADELITSLKAGTLDSITTASVAKDLLKNGESLAVRQSSSNILASTKFMDDAVREYNLAT